MSLLKSVSNPTEQQANAHLTLKVAFALAMTTILLWGWYLYTGQMWEDFLITLRHSRNAALGNGLVFTPGERVHGFTSPLNVLVPAAILAFRPSAAPETVLVVYNIMVTLLLLAASVPLYRYLILRNSEGIGPWLVLPLIIGLNLKICSFSMNGQEAGFTLAFLGIALVSLWRDEASAWKMMGLSWGGLMWTRPDSPVLIVALCMASLLFTDQPRKQMLHLLLKSASMCAVIYLPWFFWASWYYGSPVPHTIIAKHLYKTYVNGNIWYWLQKYVVALWEVLPRQFSPPYAEFGGWPNLYLVACRSLALLTCFYWVFPGRDRIAKSASFLCMIWMLYQGYVEVLARAFPWYFPAAGFAGAIVLMRGICRLSELGRAGKMVGFAVSILVVGLLAYGFAVSLTPLKLRQNYVEDGVRRKVGLWLKENVRPEEHVYLEPIGYIGYFCNCSLYDYPGLVSPAVVNVLRENKTDFNGCIKYLNPEWLVLRINEFKFIKENTNILENYKTMKMFTPTSSPSEFIIIRGNDNTYALNSDLIYYVMKRLDLDGG